MVSMVAIGQILTSRICKYAKIFVICAVLQFFVVALPPPPIRVSAPIRVPSAPMRMGTFRRTWAEPIYSSLSSLSSPRPNFAKRIMNTFSNVMSRPRHWRPVQNTALGVAAVGGAVEIIDYLSKRESTTTKTSTTLKPAINSSAPLDVKVTFSSFVPPETFWV